MILKLYAILLNGIAIGIIFLACGIIAGLVYYGLKGVVRDLCKHFKENKK